MKGSIKVKSAVFLVVLMLLTVGVLSYAVLSGIKNNQRANYESFLLQQSKLANLYINQAYAEETAGSREAVLKSKGEEMAKQIGLLSGMHVVLYNQHGELVGNSFPQGQINDVKDIIPYSLKGNNTYQIFGEELDYLAPVFISNTQSGIVQLSYSLKVENAFYNNIFRLFLIIGTITFAVSSIIGYCYFNSITTDILKLKDVVERIKGGNYKDITVLNRKDELKELSNGIYFMSNKIQENIKGMEKEQEKLSLAVEKLRALEKQQKYFIGNITHEFKTPLTVIKAYLDLMEMYTDDPKLVEDAKVKIADETQRLYEMVEKVLNITAVEKYDFESQAEKVEIKELIEGLCSRMEGKIKKFGLAIDTELEKAEIWADRDNITQIFVNMIDNAIKYNKPNGQVNIKSYIKDNKVYVEIKNTGKSIPYEVGDKIFEPFFRLDKDRSRETGGSGLGLALVKRLVESKRGEIKLLNNYNEGTAFQLMFPIFL